MTKFVYDLFGQPQPRESELDYDLNRLLFIEDNVGEPTYLIEWDTRDQLGPLDTEIICLWLERRFEPALTLMLFDSQDNYYKAKHELSVMGSYKTILDRYFKASQVEKRSKQRLKELSFDDDLNNLNLNNSIKRLKRTLTFLSKHLELESPEYLTLCKTEKYTLADINLYNYLKRIMVGKYKDYGLRSHIKLCDYLVKFMSRYESKNPHVVPAREDDGNQDSTLVNDFIKPVGFSLAVIVFFLWRVQKK